MKRALLALLLLALGAGAWPARAQEQPPITVQVRAGYDGAYRIAEWFPINVDVANDGPDVRAVLEWRFPGQLNEGTFQHVVDLPRGSRKRVTLSAYSQTFAQNGRLRVLDGEAVLLEQDIRLETVEASRFLIGVVSTDPTLLNSLNSLQVAGAGGTTVRHLDAAALPDSAAALRGLDMLFLHDIDTGALQPTQRGAIELWTQLGGQLVISGGLNGLRALSGFADIAPVEGGAGVAEADLSPLARLAGSSTGPGAAGAAVSEVSPRAGAEALPAPAPLVYRSRLGSGSVVFTAFDLAALRGWTGEVDLWQQLLTPGELFTPGANARQQRTNLLQNVLRLPSLNLPSAGTLLSFMLVYILVVGPINYLILRRLRRLELAWLTIPATVVLFTTAFYLIGFGLRGSGAQVSQLAVVQGVEGTSRGFGTSFVGLFSPRRTRYDLGFPAGTLLSEARGWTDDDADTSASQTSDAGVEIPDVLVDVGSVRSFIAEGASDVPLQVQSAIRDESGALRGEVRNIGSEPLLDAIVVRGETFWSLGTVAPGAAGSLPESAGRNFPSGVNLSQVGFFNREQMISSLFDGSGARFRRAAPRAAADAGVYLLAWAERPSLSVQLNGQGATQDGLTLYVIRLNV